MTESLGEKFPYSLDIIVDCHFPGDTLDYQEEKALGTILWIIKWSDGFNEVDCFEIAKRAIANYGLAFDFDEKEVAWAIIRMLEKGVLSSVFMGPVNDLSIRSTVIPAIKIVKVNNDRLIADVLNHDGRHKIILRSDHSSYLKSQTQSYNTLSDENRINIKAVIQNDELSNIEEFKN